MTRPAALILFLLSALAGAVLFAVSFQVTALEDRLVVLNKQIADDREALHVLHAEWSYLNQPARLASLSERYLDLQPLEGAQMTTIGDLPMRTPDDALVAAAPDTQAAQPAAAQVTLASTSAAQPKAKPAPPLRLSQEASRPVRPVAPLPVQTAAATSDDSAALDAALHAIFGSRAGTRGGARQ